MINLRYHIVSLAAVFIALALGVIAGTTVINPGVVSSLRKLNIARTKTLNDAHTQIATLREQLKVWDGFGSSLMPALTHDALKGLHLFIMEQDGASQDASVAIEDAVTQAGAIDTGRIILTKRWKLADASTIALLATDVGSQATDPVTVLRDAGARIAARIATPADPSADGDLLGTLQRDGFLSLRGIPPGPFPATRSAIVFFWSGAPDAFPDPAFALAFFGGLPAKALAVAAEPLDASSSLCDRVRNDDLLVRRVAGIDHADLAPGRLSLISALRDLNAGLPAPQYGIRRGASAIVPPSSTS